MTDNLSMIPHLGDAFFSEKDFSGLTFHSAASAFFTHCHVERQYAEQSLAKIKECYTSWLLRFFNSLPVSSLRPLHVLAFRRAMESRGLSVARQYSLLMTLKLFLRFCRDVLEVPCMDPGQIRLPRRVTPRVSYLTNAEIEAVRSCIGSYNILGLRLRAIFEVLLNTGMRISELLSLNRDSIDRDSNQAVILGKGGKSRVIFFAGGCLLWLDRYLGARSDIHEAIFVTSGKAPRRLSRGDIPRYFKALARSAGIDKHLTPHLLRHTFCTNLRNNGADISLIKELAGHNDIETTARYYLGKDTKILQDTVHRYLDFRVTKPSDRPDTPQADPR